MAILNNDVYNYNGLQLIDTYVCISQSMIGIYYDKLTNSYYINIQYSIYGSQANKQDGFPSLANLVILEHSEKIPEDIYAYSYDKLKKIYPNYTDC